MTNYIPDDFLADFDPGEPPELPPVADDLIPPEDDFDPGEPPDLPDFEIDDVPPDDFFRPDDLIGFSESELAMPAVSETDAAAPPTQRQPLDTNALLSLFDVPSDDLAYRHTDDLMFKPSPALNQRGLETRPVNGLALLERYQREYPQPDAEMLVRAEQIHLVDARFIGYSDDAGHHVAAIEILDDPVRGDQFGQVLPVGDFENVDHAETLYVDLQNAVHEGALPNYAVASLAGFSRTDRGLPLDLTTSHLADEREMGIYQVSVAADRTPDDPPQHVMNEIADRYSDPSLVLPELAMLPVLDYGIDVSLRSNETATVEIVKEVNGGLRNGGDEERRVIALYDTPDEAFATVRDLVAFRDEVLELTDGNTVAGWQALTSLAHETGNTSGLVKPGEPLFIRNDLPSDPFCVEPAEMLFQHYEQISAPALTTLEPEFTLPQPVVPTLDL